MSTKSRVLVVDDDPVNINIIQESFDNRYELKAVASGEEALQVVGKFKPDLVLLDIMMPGMDGYETCRRIKETPDLKFTKVIMVSAKTMVNERLTGYGSGADDYITKPFNDDELLAKVRVYLNLKFLEEFKGFKENMMKLIAREIRSPLSSVVGRVNTLSAQGDPTLEGARAAIEDIVRQGQRIIQMCDESLLLCDLKDGRSAQKDDVVWSEFIQNILQGLGPQILDKKLSVSHSGNLTSPVKMDKELMGRAFRTVLENSIRYSHTGAQLGIIANETSGEYVISIVDQGKSITSRIFQEVAAAQSLDQAGEGVSFSIAKIAARLNGGDLVYNQGVSGGVVFTFFIPK